MHRHGAHGGGIAAHGDGAVVLAKAGPAHVALHIFRKEEKWIVATFHLKVQKRKIRREEKFENKESNVRAAAKRQLSWQDQNATTQTREIFHSSHFLSQFFGPECHNTEKLNCAFFSLFVTIFWTRGRFISRTRTKMPQHRKEKWSIPLTFPHHVNSSHFLSSFYGCIDLLHQSLFSIPKTIQLKVQIWAKIDSIQYLIQMFFMTIQFQ